MARITVIGAGSMGFTRGLVRDVLTFPSLADATISLMDVNPERLDFAYRAVKRIVELGGYPAKVEATLDRAEAVKDADAVLCTILAGDVSVWQHDILIPKKYGIDTNIGDTRSVSGIFRALRTIPVMLDFAADVEAVCPDAWFLNYVNPMAMITGAMLQGTDVRTVGLCHSVQGCAWWLLKQLGMIDSVKKLQWKIAGINHQGWLLEITDGGKDLYPEIRRRAAKMNAEARKPGAKKHWDMVRFEIMRHFGYYVTESSEHSSEYMPYWIKKTHPELIAEFNIPLDEYPRRCIAQIRGWKKQRDEIVKNKQLGHTRTHEYGSYIMEAMETDVPFRIGGNVLNTGLITNLPAKACVEVPCMVDRGGVHGCCVGDLPEQCAAMNRTNINVQLLTIEAALTRKKDRIYQAAMMDPHTGAELTLDEIRGLCDDLIQAHGNMLPEYD